MISEEEYEILKELGEETEVKKDIEWAIKEIEGLETEPSQNYPHDEMIEKEKVLGILRQLDELRLLSHEWMDKYVLHVRGLGDVIEAEVVERLLVPKQEEVDRAYKDGYEKGKEHAGGKEAEETEVFPLIPSISL